MSSKKTDDAPIQIKDWKRKIKTERAERLKKPLKLNFSQQAVQKMKTTGFKHRAQVRKGMLQTSLYTKEIGVHSFPPSIRSVGVTSTKIKRTVKRERLSGFKPSHLSLKSMPAKLSKSLAKPFWIPGKVRKGKNIAEPTTVFNPDTRYTFSDTSFPWCTCGKVETAAGWGSGVMIGPRHVMTASHVVNWGSGSSVGWLRFTPLYFDGSAPFGVAFATRVYYWLRADGSDGLNLSEGAFDYVVCTLDWRMGNVTGWMGSRAYSRSWNGGAFWAHIGYPQDMAAGERPAFIGNGVIDDTDTASTSGRSSFRMEHRIDVIPGQSGGPYFGWWSGEAWPRVVGIQSGQNLGGVGGPNTSGGGNPLSELINFARNAEP